MKNINLNLNNNTINNNNTNTYDEKTLQTYNSNINTNNIIIFYNDQKILPAKFFLPFALSLTCYYLIQKLSDNFMARWQVCFYPILFFIIFNFFSAFLKIIKAELGFEEEDKNNIYIENIDKISLLSNFFKMILSGFCFFSIYYFALFMDFNKDENLIFSLKMIIGACISSIIYFFLKFSKSLSIRKNNIPIKENENEENNESGSLLSFYSSLTAPILTYFSNMMIVCSGGACHSIVASTIGSLLGAFGVTVSNFSAYLFPFTIILLAVSLYSLYAKRKQFTHKPFLLGVFSCFLILIAHFNETNYIYYLIYPGNICMIGAAIWNAKINKFTGLPRFKK
jgi:hypothetical protein